MEKEFIPYDQALELKELGFNEPCFGWFRSTLIPSNFTEYFLETEFGMNESPSDWVNSNFLDKACSAPLYQQAFRWLLALANKDKLFSNKWTISYNEDYYSLFLGGCNMGVFEEELECLKKLIEIVKQNNNE